MKATTDKSPIKSTTLGQRRISATTEILKLIDSALNGCTLSAEEALAAPTTFEFINNLDGPATGKMTGFGVRVKKFPAQIFSRYDPELQTYSGMIEPDYGKMIPFNPATLAAVIASAGPFYESTAILEDEDLAFMRELQAKFNAIGKQIAPFSIQAAHAEFRNQKNRCVAEALENGALSANPIRTLESIIGEFNAKRAALNAVQIDISQRAYPIVLKAYRKTFEIVRGTMARLEQAEREQAATYKIPWVPSYVWKSCAAIQIRLYPSRIADNVASQVSPQSLLVGLIQL